jgi:hypothetical protein
MKLGRRPGAFTSFVDAFSEEAVLHVEASQAGANLVSFHLYDCNGVLVQDSDGLQNFPAGAEVRAEDEELLLLVPPDPEDSLQYCLYNKTGILLTRSDGVRTQVFGGLRLIGNKPLAGRPPAARVAAEVATD